EEGREQAGSIAVLHALCPQGEERAKAVFATLLGVIEAVEAALHLGRAPLLGGVGVEVGADLLRGALRQLERVFGEGRLLGRELGAVVGAGGGVRLGAGLLGGRRFLRRSADAGAAGPAGELRRRERGRH